MFQARLGLVLSLVEPGRDADHVITMLVSFNSFVTTCRQSIQLTCNYNNDYYHYSNYNLFSALSGQNKILR